MVNRRKYKYDIAISFAEEDRNIALAVRSAFKLEELKKIRVYYYADKPEETWGYKLKERLPKIYRDEARYSLLILSEKYPHKKYCRIELEAIRERIKREEDRYLFILTTDDTDPSRIDLADDYAFREWNYDPEQLTEILSQILKPQKSPWPIVAIIILIVACIGGVNMYNNGNSEPTGRNKTESVESTNEPESEPNNLYQGETIANTDSTKDATEKDSINESSDEKLEPSNQDSKLVTDAIKEKRKTGTDKSNNTGGGGYMDDVSETDSYWDTGNKGEDPGHVFEKELMKPALFTRYIEATAKADIAILIVDSAHNQQLELEPAMEEKLRDQEYNAYRGLLNKDIVNPHVFRQLTSNNIWSLKKYSPERKLDYIIVGELSWVSGMYDSESPYLTATLKLNILDLKGNSNCAPVSFEAKGSIGDKQEILKGLANKITLEFSCSFSN